jgi:type IV secretion system protein VirB4
MMNLAEYRRKGTRLADYLPWAALVAPGVVLNKDGSLQRSARFRGPDLHSAVAAELVAVAGRINNAFRRLGSGWAIFVEAQRVAAADYPDSRFPDPASALLDAERCAGFAEQGAHFQSEYFLTFLYLPPAEEAARAETWLYEGRDKTGIDAGEVLRGFIDRTDRVLALFDGIMPECRWLDDSETLTYLHSTISTQPHRVRVPETPAYLDALLADQPLTGGLEPRLGDAHLRVLTLSGFPTATTPGILDEFNRLAFPYRWATRAILMDKTEAARMVARIRRQWFAKRKSIAAILKEVMTNEQSALVDTDAANKAADADMALQELGADIAGEAYVTAPRRRETPPGREDGAGQGLHGNGRDGQCRRCLARVTAGAGLRQCAPAADLDPEPRPYDPALRRLGGGGAGQPFRRPAFALRQDRGRDALPSFAPCG